MPQFQKRCDNIHQVIRELDLWMSHYIEWAVQDKMPSLSSDMEDKAKTIEKARNLLCEKFGEPGDNGE